MREIKFRIFDGVEMNYNVIGFDYNCGGIKRDIVTTFHEKYGTEFYQISDNFPLMQYTGLKDKNGKEIYEGDIFKDCEGKIKLVIWEDNGFKSKYTFKRRYQGEEWFENSITDLGDTQSRRWGVEVIGNIYENEDLLEK